MQQQLGPTVTHRLRTHRPRGVFSARSQRTSRSQVPEKFLPVSPGPLFLAKLRGKSKD